MAGKPTTDAPTWAQVVQAGFDPALLEDNLRRTIWERIQRHSRALRTAAMLKAGKKLDA